MGWFITQSLLFIIVTAVIFFVLGLWVGWILWARRNKTTGKHAAEATEKKSTTANTTPAAAGSTATAAQIAGNDDTADTADTDASTSTTTSAPEAEEAPVATASRATADTTSPDTDASGEAAADGTDAQAAADAQAQAAGTASDTTSDTTSGTAADQKSDETPGTAAGGDAADTTAGGDAPEPSDIEDENLAVYAGAEAEVVAEAEAATREAAVDDRPEDGTEPDGGTEPAAETVALPVVEPGTTSGTVSDAEPEAEPDDLTRIEGVGPKIAAALRAGGYGSYAELAEASEKDIRAALAEAGITFAPAAMSFAAQAQYLTEGDEEGLEEYQDYLIAGRERRSAEFVEDVDYTDVDEVEGDAAKQAALEADAAKVAETTGEDVDTAAVADDAGSAVAAAPEQPADEDLKVIEGIGPKIETALKADGITSYAQVAALSVPELRASIARSGIKFAPSVKSWAQQAQYLVDGDGEGLDEYQDYLIAGQERGTTTFVEDVDYTDVDEVEGDAAKQAALEADAAKVAEAESGKA